MKVTIFLTNNGYKKFEADIEAVDSLHGQLNDNCEFITVKAIDGERILAKDHIVSIDVVEPDPKGTVIDTKKLTAGVLEELSKARITIGGNFIDV